VTKPFSEGFLTRKHKSAVVILFSLLLIQFYGLTASNGSANSSTSTSTSVTQLWSFSVAESLIGSPIVVDGYMYVNSRFDNPRGSIYCLNASTGTEVWNYTTYKTSGDSPPINGIPFSPIVFDGKVYFGVNFGYVFCLDAYTGAQIWNFTGEGYSGSPVLIDGYVYACFGKNVYALSASTGARIWNQTISDLTGYLVTTGGYVYVTRRGDEDSSNGIVCLDAHTGVKKWEYITSEYVGSIVVSEGQVYIGSYHVNTNDGNIVFTGNVYCLDAYTGTKKWNYTTGSYQGNSPIFTPTAAGNIVYVGAGNNVYALNASNGTKIWNFTTEGNADSPLFLTPYLYVSSGASVYCFDASTGARIWNYTTENSTAYRWTWLSASSPVVTDDQIFVGSVGPQYSTYPYHNVYALNASTGEQIWNYTITGNAASLTVADGVVYVGASFATTLSPDHYESVNSAIYALKPIAVTPSPLPSTLVVIAVVVGAVILVVVFLVYRIRRKGADKSAAQHVVSKP
jgi:outer membrane protein assembly factor BamB